MFNKDSSMGNKKKKMICNSSLYHKKTGTQISKLFPSQIEEWLNPKLQNKGGTSDSVIHINQRMFFLHLNA